MKPFVHLPLKKGFLSKIFHAEENFYAELNNLFADAQTIREVTKKDIEQLLEKYGYNNFLGRRVIKGKLKEIVKRYTEYLVEREKIHEQKDELSYLLEVLSLTAKDVSDIAEDALRRLLKLAVKDKKFDDTEKLEMKTIIEVFNIPEDKAKKIYAEVVKEALENYIIEATEDGDWSPEEEEILMNFAKEFNVDLSFDEKTKDMLERLRFAWKVQKGDIPPIDVNIKLQRGEKCYFTAPATLAEWRKEVISQSYSGPRISFKIAKGIYLSHGTYKRRREEREVLKEIDYGDVYLTNKRVIFLGSRKFLSLKFSKILDIKIYSDGVTLYKESGKPIVLLFDKAEEFGILFSALWTDS